MRLCILSLILAGLLCFVGYVLHESTLHADEVNPPQKQAALYMLTETEERADGVTITRTYTGPLPPDEALGRKNEVLPTATPQRKGHK